MYPNYHGNWKGGVGTARADKRIKTTAHECSQYQRTQDEVVTQQISSREQLAGTITPFSCCSHFVSPLGTLIINV